MTSRFALVARAVNTRRAVFAAAVLIVLARSAVFLIWGQSHLDSNQAVFGLMAKHIAEGRAFPLFMYGQPYMLAVEAWLAAPLFFLTGVSVAALKLPLLALNLAVALLLVWLLVRDGLPPVFAGIATLFFLLPAPGTASKLVEASGGTLEPFLYVVLLWVTRNRPELCGLVLGVGFLNREFTIYGFLALLILSAAHRSLFTADGLRRMARLLRVTAEVWVVVQVARPFSSAMGPGTTAADLSRRGSDLVEIVNRLCLDWGAIPAGFVDIVRVHWPLLFGTSVQPLNLFSIESTVTQGMRGAGWLLGAAMIVAVVRIAGHVIGERRWRPEYDFCAYLVLAGSLSVMGYVVGRCGVITLPKMRYDMLSILGAVGLAAWYLHVEGSKWLRAAWIVLVVAFVGVAAASHARLWSEYLWHAPVGGKRLIARHLEARGIRYAIADYATAYPVSFWSNERIIVSSSNRVRISEYKAEVGAHLDQAVSIERRPCGDGTLVMPGVYFCRP